MIKSQIVYKLIFAFLFMTPMLSHALLINQVVIEGNTKTKKESILKWGGIQLNKEISAVEFEEMVEKLSRAYQFKLIDIKFDAGILLLKIEEKWSLFPVPMISQSGDYYSRGFLIYENNFLGRLGTFAPAVLWTNSGMNGLFYYQEDNIIAQDIGMKILLLHKADLTEFERKEKVVDTFETRFDTVILTPNLHVGRHDHKLGPIYIKKKIVKVGNENVFSSERYGLYYRHHYNNYKKLPILFDGIYTSFDYFLLPDDGGKYDFLTGGDIQYSRPIQNHFFKAQLHFHYTNNSGYLSPKMLGGNEGFRGYDRESLPVQRNVGFMLQQQLNIFGQVYVTPFYEYNISKLIEPVQNGLLIKESTVGFNGSYYFDKISIPAIILELARNLEDQSYHLHLNIGVAL